MVSTPRLDKHGTHRVAFEKNKKAILKTESICAICGKPVDKKLRYPNPLAPTIDHIIPVSKGGHPSDRENLQLAHWTCNRQKSDKLLSGQVECKVEALGNRNLPQTINWLTYSADD